MNEQQASKSRPMADDDAEVNDGEDNADFEDAEADEDGEELVSFEEETYDPDEEFTVEGGEGTSCSYYPKIYY
jgi:hypothetical protein